MFMGGFARPIPELGFDGRIFLKRISERKVWKKTSYNQCFSNNPILNNELMVRIGICKARIHDNTLTFSGLSQQLSNHYDLNIFLYGHLTFTRASYV